MSVFVYAIVGLILAVSAWFLFGGSSKAAPAPAAAVAPARKPPHASAPAAHTRATRDKYDPNKSQLAPDLRAGFLAAANWNDPVDVVPGIGPAYAKLLRKQNVLLVSQLLGKFLTLKQPGGNVLAQLDAFYDWLSDVGISGGQRSGITQCVAEKINSMMPGSYSEAALGL